MNTSIEKIKELMIDFTQPITFVEEAFNQIIINSEDFIIKEEDKFEPYEILYLFQHILGMKIDFKPFEKIAFILYFLYRNIEIAFVLQKLSFNLYIQKIINYESIYNELRTKIWEAIKLSNELFKIEAENSINKRNIVFPNYYLRFERAFECLEQQIEYNFTNKNDWPKCDHRADCFINSYAIYLVSYIEHITILLYPFSDYYDIQNDIKKFVVDTKIIEKIENIFPDILSENTLIKDKINLLINYIRNPIAHGYLTKNYFGNILIPDIGYVPMSYSNYKLSIQYYLYIPFNLEDQYTKMKEIKDIFDSITEQFYPNGIEIIKSGLDIHCDTKSQNEYLLITKDREKTKEYIIRKSYEVNYWINMDW